MCQHSRSSTSIRTSGCSPSMGQHGLTDREAALAQLVAFKPHRECFLTQVDVHDIESAVRRTTWQRHSHQQCSLALSAEAAAEDVLVCELQESLAGTPDAGFYHSTQGGCRKVHRRGFLGAIWQFFSATPAAANRPILQRADIGTTA